MSCCGDSIFNYLSIIEREQEKDRERETNDYSLPFHYHLEIIEAVINSSVQPQRRREIRPKFNINR